jgi:hypothetical protein
VRENLSRIAGCTLLVCAFILLICSPPGFSIIHFFIFLLCFVSGFLLVSGIIGTHPVAARIRRLAIRNIAPRTGPLVYVPEQLFPYESSSIKRRLASGVCFVIGLCMVGLGVLVVYLFPSKSADTILMGIPPWACGILCLWISIRYPSRYIQVTPQGITVHGYFGTRAMPWQNILVLIARQHFVGFTAIGVLYSLYSDRSKVSFSSHIPGSDRLVALVSEATGLTWNPKPPMPNADLHRTG